MTTASYVWQDGFDKLAAAGHNARGELPTSRQLYRDANTAYSLYCTPAEYGLFLAEMLKLDRSAPHSLNAKSLADMLTRTTKV